MHKGFKFYPSRLPRIRCLICKKMAERTEWYPKGYSPRIREFKCVYGHLSYIEVSDFFLETEIYLKRRVVYDKAPDDRQS